MQNELNNSIRLPKNGIDRNSTLNDDSIIHIKTNKSII